MINLLVIGHKYEHDLFELVRTFLPDKEIRIINSLNEYIRTMVFYK